MSDVISYFLPHIDRLGPELVECFWQTATMVAVSGTIAWFLGVTIGAGGLGDFAIRYGYQMGYRDMIWRTVIIILAVITVVQCLGQWIIRKTSH